MSGHLCTMYFHLPFVKFGLPFYHWQGAISTPVVCLLHVYAKLSNLEPIVYFVSNVKCMISMAKAKIHSSRHIYIYMCVRVRSREFSSQDRDLPACMGLLTQTENTYVHCPWLNLIDKTEKQKCSTQPQLHNVCSSLRMVIYTSIDSICSFIKKSVFEKETIKCIS
jgi:hypothetical protein